MNTRHADLSFETLPALDEKLVLLLRKHLANVAQDCISRPGDETARKVCLEFIFKPTRDPDTGECDVVNCEVECKSKVPIYRSRVYPMRVHKSGFLFNRDFPEELDQPPLFTDPEDE